MWSSTKYRPRNIPYAVRKLRLSFLCTAIILILGSGCSKNEEESQPDTPSAPKSISLNRELIVPGNVKTQEFVFTANTPWTIQLTPNDWCSISPLQGEAGEVSITVSVKPNRDKREKYVRGRYSEDRMAFDFVVCQCIPGSDADGFFDIRVPSAGQLAAQAATLPVPVDNIARLRIAGPLDDTDCALLKGWQQFLSVLDLEKAEVDLFPDLFFCSSVLSEVTLPTSMTSLDRLFFARYDGDWSASAIGIVNIPEASKITSFGDYAFTGCHLKHITLPKGLKSIGINALPGGEFTHLELPEALEYIGPEAFEYSNLQSVTIPPKIRKIERKTFRNTSLKTIDLPAAVESIEDMAFASSYSLSEVRIAQNSRLRSIGQHAFASCPLLQITLPNGLETIGEGAFAGTLLQRIDFPATLTTISSGAFQHCKRLSGILLPASLTTLGSAAFSECESLRSVSWGINIEETEPAVFAGCKSLERFEFPDGSRISFLEGQFFRYCTALKTVILTASFSVIDNSAFMGCTALENIVCKRTTPPKIFDDLENVFEFGEQQKNTCVLTVPAGCAEAYRADRMWGQIVHIVEDNSL